MFAFEGLSKFGSDMVHKLTLRRLVSEVRRLREKVVNWTRNWLHESSRSSPASRPVSRSQAQLAVRLAAVAAPSLVLSRATMSAHFVRLRLSSTNWQQTASRPGFTSSRVGRAEAADIEANKLPIKKEAVVS